MESGTVALRKTDEHGNSILLRLCHSGDSTGYREFFSGGPTQVSADALVRSSVCHVRSEAVHSLLHTNPALG